MRLYAPLYEGDGILRPDAAFGESAAKLFRGATPGADFVRSNNAIAAANATLLDVHAIEQAARRQRSEALARMLKSLFKAIGDWLENNQNFERDQFFAASENLADLEQRQRHYERTGMAHY